MKASIQLSVVLLATIAAVTPSQSHAQVGLGVKASTLGIGGELRVPLVSRFALRGGANFFSFSRDEEIEGINYDITPKLRNGAAYLDLHPLASAFRLTGGVVYNKNRINIRATPVTPIEIGDMTFQPSEVGELNGRIDVDDFSPYLGLGFGGNGRVSLTFDIGVVFHGTPRASLTGITPLTGSAKVIFDQEVARELADLQQAIDDESLARYYPVISFGIVIRP